MAECYVYRKELDASEDPIWKKINEFDGGPDAYAEVEALTSSEEDRMCLFTVIRATDESTPPDKFTEKELRDYRSKCREENAI